MKQQRSSTRMGFRGVVIALAMAGTLVTAGVFRVWTRTQCVKLGYAIAAAQEDTERLEAERARLEAEAAALKSPIRISTIAEKRLGLQPQVPEQVIALRPESHRRGPTLAKND